MAPYSLSACQVVRVFYAVMRALGASPIMSLGIVFLAGYPTCARPPPPLRFCACAPRCFSKIFGRSFFERSSEPHKKPWRGRHVRVLTRQPPGVN
eukprot:scaffold3419_cov84-Skeletonema_dohrnii-CCMP3373.AAC.1